MSLRSRYEELKPHLWTEEEAKHHLTTTFNQSVAQWPDIMEPYVVMLVDAKPHEEVEIMRRGLRVTVMQRYASIYYKKEAPSTEINGALVGAFNSTGETER